VRGWAPVEAKVVLKDAVPLAPAVAVALAGVTLAVPIAVLPSLNVTVPVGPCVLLLWDAMLTERVTAWFAGTGFGLAPSEALVEAGVTVTMSATGVVTEL